MTSRLRVPDDLEVSLAALAGLLTGPVPLTVTLERVAALAVLAIPGADGAGLALLETGRPQTVVATDAFVAELDDVQYALGEGPCLTAVDTGTTVRSGDLGAEPDYPRFGPRAGRLGVHSALSVPLVAHGAAVGSLNVYARGRDAYGAEAIRIGEAFAEPAAVIVAGARALAEAERLVTRLTEALESRAQVERAVGVVMSRTGESAALALESLRAMSRARSTPLATVAAQVLDEAAARARRAARDEGRPPAG